MYTKKSTRKKPDLVEHRRILATLINEAQQALAVIDFTIEQEKAKANEISFN